MKRRPNSPRKTITWSIAYQEQRWPRDVSVRRLIVRVTRPRRGGSLVTGEVAILVSHPTLPAERCIRLILRRWLQENDIRVLIMYLGLDQLDSYRSTPYRDLPPGSIPVDKPAVSSRRRVRGSARHARAELLNVRDILKTLYDLLPMENRARRHFGRALVILNKLYHASPRRSLLAALRRHGEVFDELRGAFRMAEPDTCDGYASVEAPGFRGCIETEVRGIRDRLAPDSEYSKLVEQLDRHWEGLFRDPIELHRADRQVQLLHPERTNNRMEQLFGCVSRAHQHRTGVSFNARSLNAMLPAMPLSHNLSDPDYMCLLLDGAADLAERFSRIDAAEARAHIAQHRQAGSLFDRPRRVRKIMLKPTTVLRVASYALTCEISRLASACTATVSNNKSQNRFTKLSPES
jgi:hypothetical protein